MTGLDKYFRSLVSFAEGEEVAGKMELSQAVEVAYEHMHKAEHEVGTKLLDFLSTNPRVRILGSPTMQVVYLLCFFFAIVDFVTL